MFLYIDPGTGSMLFSILIGLLATLYFLARAFFIKLKFLITGRNTSAVKKEHSIVIYNEGIQYWNNFKPVLESLERKKIAAAYLTSAENDPFFTESYEYISGEFIGKGNKAFARLNFLEADICLMTTPGLEVYQLKRSKGVRHYAHMLHDTGDATCYRLFGIDWFDSVLLSGDYQAEDIRTLENIRDTPKKELPVVGCTYLDVLGQKKKTLPPIESKPFTVLVSPSWGPGSLLQAFGEKLLDPLAETGWHILLRPHPQSLTAEKDMIDRLSQRYDGYRNIEWDFSPENLNSLARADVMLSDFSGIIFDYTFLFDRPVLYNNSFFNIEMYDASDLDHMPWRFEILKKLARELDESCLADIKQIITESVQDSERADIRRQARDQAWQYAGQSGDRVTEYLLEIRERIHS
ncbi:CDP-glycerol glycerophosphotransferase family protein [Brucepastera parasyntrophica]|uniref:CDP-glycerol glycerophosphotransferase family protein n=1 Tax=Brucepastera parasyntrophica TaxID=2880008 RepID=UPI00210B5217|nr:CDP-glycerol glycerophosphotransferase family protein [Brucepastera parasyntrophica]ULQ59925.1 CDP-glycerol glycerophosphotransferase family protein [Brucepastera parasyntrophica]